MRPVLLLLLTVLLAAPARAQMRWRLVSQTGPTPRLGHAMSFQPGHPSRIVLHAGCPRSRCHGQLEDYEALLQDSWTFDGASWSPLSVANPPPARWGHAIGLVGAEHVVFSGASLVPRLDTWALGLGWREITDAVHPKERWFPAFARDTDLDRLVVFGGRDSGNVDQNDTWIYSSGGWRRVATSGPSPSGRSSTAMAYDSDRREFVLFGGNDGFKLAGTWLLKCDALDPFDCAWSERTPSLSPVGRMGHAMAFDAERGVVVLFGGERSANDGAGSDETWEWNGTTWHQEPVSGPPSPRRSHAMAWDEDRLQIVLFGGGLGSQSVPSAETWIYDVKPAADAGSDAGFDAGSDAGLDAGFDAGATSDGGTGSDGGGEEPDTEIDLVSRYGCASPPVAALALFAIALRLRRRRTQ